MVKPLKSPWKPPPVDETRGSIDLIFTLPKPLKKFHASVLARDWGNPRSQKYPKSKILVWRQLRELTNYSSYSSWLTLSNSILCFDLLPFLKHLLLKHKARSLIILILFDCLSFTGLGTLHRHFWHQESNCPHSPSQSWGSTLYSRNIDSFISILCVEIITMMCTFFYSGL